MLLFIGIMLTSEIHNASHHLLFEQHKKATGEKCTDFSVFWLFSEGKKEFINEKGLGTPIVPMNRVHK